MERLNGTHHELALRLFMIVVLAHWGEHLLQGFQIPWAVVTLAITATALWITSQPMDMRAVAFPG
jgi:hypothetical protein